MYGRLVPGYESRTAVPLPWYKKAWFFSLDAPAPPGLLSQSLSVLIPILFSGFPFYTLLRRLWVFGFMTPKIWKG
jgi:hypothetical protein